MKLFALPIVVAALWMPLAALALSCEGSTKTFVGEPVAHVVVVSRRESGTGGRVLVQVTAATGLVSAGENIELHSFPMDGDWMQEMTPGSEWMVSLGAMLSPLWSIRDRVRKKDSDEDDWTVRDGVQWDPVDEDWRKVVMGGCIDRQRLPVMGGRVEGVRIDEFMRAQGVLAAQRREKQ